MDISVFTTQQTAGSGKAAGAAGQGAGAAVLSAAGAADFLGLILARLAAADGSGQPDAGGGTGKDAPSAVPPLLHPHAKAGKDAPASTLPAPAAADSVCDDCTAVEDALTALLSGDGIADTAPAVQASDTTVQATDAKKSGDTYPGAEGLQKALAHIIAALLHGTPHHNAAADTPAAANAETAVDEEAGQTPAGLADLLSVQAADGDDAAPALIAAGLSPGEIVKLIKRLAARSGEDGGDGAKDALPVAVLTAPPSPTDSQVEKPLLFAPRGSAAPIQTAPPQGGADGAAATPLTPDARPTPLVAGGMQDMADGSGDAAESDENGFDDILRLFERGQSKNGAADLTAPAAGRERAAAVAAARAPSSAAAPHILQGLPVPETGLFADADGSPYPDGFSFALTPGGGGLHGASTGAALTSLSTSAPQAAYPHPATQMIAATLARNAAGGESKSMTLHLDPPELGRVQVRLEFKDNVLKAHMVIEKPETYMMLQRDAHVLERALQDAGMDAAGGGDLSFELAQDGNFFGNDGNGSGGGGAGGGSGGGAADSDLSLEAVSATPDWYVDPETGLTRYDALA